MSGTQLLSLNTNKTKMYVVKRAETASCGPTKILCPSVRPKAQRGFDINQQ